MSMLPEDVVAEILLRLPAGDLVQLKTVRKLWYELITSSRFVESHLQRWTGHGGGILFVRSLTDHIMEPSYLSLDDSSVDRLCDDFIRGSQLLSDGGVDKVRVDYSVLESCDGLLLTRIEIDYGIKCEVSLLVCNPLTRSARLLPPHPWNGPWSYELNRAHIIYDPSVKRYKVVGISTLEGCFFECYLIELDKGKHQLTPWKELKVPRAAMKGLITSVSVEGKLNVFTLISYKLWAVRLVSLDLATEEFQVVDCSLVPVPETLTSSNRFFVSNRMFYYIYYFSQNEFELFSLVDLKKGTWFRRRVTMSSPPPSGDAPFTLVQVLGGGDDSKLVFFSPWSKNFFVYETASGNFRSINTGAKILMFDGQIVSSWFPSIVHVNSLISWSRGS